MKTTTIRKTYPRIRTYDKHGKTYYRVDLRRKGYVGQKSKDFSDEKSAKQFANDIGDSVSKKGIDSIQTIQSPELASWERQCAVYGKTVKDAVSFAINHWFEEKAKLATPFMSEVLDLWIENKTNGLKKLRPKSIKTMKNCANVLKQYFGQMKIGAVTHDTIEAFLKDRNVSETTQKYYARYLQNFFNWCIRKKLCTENPANFWVSEIMVPKTTVAFYTVEQCQAIMRATIDYPNMRAFFALGLFSGIRPEEIARMTWEKNIHWEHKEIFIQAAISKTKSDRRFKMNDTTIKWLEHCLALGGNLIPKKNLRHLKDKIYKQLSFANIQDGSRHTFATYHYAEFGNYESLKQVMGNSPIIIARHYKGTISQSEVEAWKAITPDSIITPPKTA